MRRITGLRAAVLLLLSLCAVRAAIASPADYVISPIVEEGEREIDIKAGTAKLRGGGRENSESFGLGAGVNSWWFTEVYAIWHKTPGESNSFDAWEWENRFQLTETGEYPVDVGVLFEIERPQDRREGYEYRWGALLQSDLTTELQANLNLLIEKRIRAKQGGKAELGYQAQLKYRLQPTFEFGVQAFGDVGGWNDWEPADEQPHGIGPAAFGRVKLGDKLMLRYNAAALFGLTNGSARNTLRLQLEFEF